MRLDIPTLAFVTSMVFAAQTIAIFVQYRLNKAYKGFELWFLGAVFQALGFFAMLAMTMPSIWLLSALANPLVISGQILMYRGIGDFLGKRESPWLPFSLFAAFIVLYLAFIFIESSILGRTVVVLGFSALLSLMIALSIYRHKKASFLGSATFACAVFLAYGCFQIAMTLTTLLLPPLRSYGEINQIPARALSFLIPIAGSTLWSFAFIIMVNQRLNADNREEKEKLKLVFDMSPDAKLISRMDDAVLLEVNGGLLAMTGRERGELIGKSIVGSELWDEEAELLAYFSELAEKGRVDNREAFFRRKDGSRLIGVVSGRVIALDDRPHAISVIHDITELKLAEREVRNLLSEKELILKEVHHRIKNNMSTISSLLSLQAGFLEDPQAVQALEETKSRIKSMMRLYETLYESAKISAMSVAYYLPPLIDEIVSNFPKAASVRVEKDIEDFVLEVKRLQPLGIILNELLTNIMKHAFSGEGEHLIEVSASRNEGRVRVVVQDNGSGIEASPEAESASGFGMMLAETLANQLGGSLGIEREGGTRVTIDFQA